MQEGRLDVEVYADLIRDTDKYGLQGKPVEMLYEAEDEDDLLFLLQQLIDSRYDFLEECAYMFLKPMPERKRLYDLDDLERVLNSLSSDAARILRA